MKHIKEYHTQDDLLEDLSDLQEFFDIHNISHQDSNTSKF